MSKVNFGVLEERNAQLIFSSQLVSSVCDKMMSLGLVWYLTKNFSINIVPWFMAICFLPHLIMSFFSAKVINKMGVVKTIIFSEFSRAIVLFILYASFVFLKLEGTHQLIALFLSSFLVGMGSSVFNPAILSSPPKLVVPEKIAGLNALIDTSLSLSSILGATLAVFLLNLIDLKTLILLNALSFLWAGILQLFLREINQSRNLQENSHSTSVLELLKNYPEITGMLFCFLFLNLVFTPILVMIPWYVQNIYLGNSSDLAVIEGSLGVGAFMMGMFLSIRNIQIASEKRSSMIALISFFFGVFFLVFAFSQMPWQGAFALFAIGILSTFLNIQVLTFFQSSLPEEFVPTIMTAVNIISAATVPVSLGFSGLIFPFVNISNFAKVSALLLILIAILIPKILKGSLWKTA